MFARALTLFLSLSTAATAEATYVFRWDGSGGYSVDGAMRFDADLLGSIILEPDLTCFAITAKKDGETLGSWNLGHLTLNTTWRLHFDSANAAFLVVGDGVQMPQAWNMNGVGDNCGPGGVGFNIGNLAQDICLDGQLILQSQVPPSTPFPATRVDDADFPAGACILPDLLSQYQPGSAGTPAVSSLYKYAGGLGAGPQL